MLRNTDSAEKQIEKLTRINAALIRRLERIEESRGPAYALSRATAMLEREVMTRNRDLEAALSELAAINSELAAAREVADQANRAKSRFLRAASHDLLQPLSAAKLFLSHLSELSSTAMQRDLVSHLTGTIESAEELIRALSNIAKLDSRNFRTNLGPVPMGRLFRRVLIDTQPLATARRIDLRVVPSATTVLSDGVYLRQIAQNLITNALKYTTGRKILVGMRHEVTRPGAEGDDQGHHVWLEVLDQGPGIAPQDQDRIFNEFERLSNAHQPGSGLGLSIVKRICDQLGHDLELISKPGHGSRFRVRLPVVQRPELALGSPNGATAADPLTQAGLQGAAPALPSLAGRTILLIENDPTMMQALSLLLTGWQLDVASARNISEAREAALRRPPDLVLTDYRLDDDETGIKALYAVEQDLGLALPAVIISAEPADDIQQEALAEGIKVPVLAKPVAEADLFRALRKVLSAGRA